MKIEEIKKRILEDSELSQKIEDMSYAMDESDENNRELTLTIWKDGRITADQTQRGNRYPNEVYENIEKIHCLKRTIIWDVFVTTADLRDNPEDRDEDNRKTRAIESYKSMFDLKQYLERTLMEDEEA